MKYVDLDTIEAVQAFYLECPECGSTELVVEVFQDNTCIDCGCKWVILFD